MSLDKNRVLVECEQCGLIFRVNEQQYDNDEIVLCDLIPEKDLGHRKNTCERPEDDD